jgi:hypothetical protein
MQAMPILLRILLRAFLVAEVLFIMGCTTDRVAQNVYEGLRNRDETAKTPAEKTAAPRPLTYFEYEAERRGLEKRGE